ncbi:hypothetical protein [Arenibaculum sp.]|jgi:hypothetical protein|uniref:hypothetical protein n=1 Tax=Arenibaculum sp. TaxID=2865862 RepID=UPI002E11A836|nr:hypothetical protein [Arenibaculum sp.]
MVKLASLGNMDPQEAVLDLLEWRNSDYPEVRRVLAEIKKKAVAASIGLLISVGALLGTPHEAAAAGMMSAKTGYTIYYGK